MHFQKFCSLRYTSWWVAVLMFFVMPLQTWANTPADGDSHLAPRPNFIIILADDLGYGDLGCYGQEKIKTPNLDRMAAEGTRFTDFYVAASICTPSRAALLTGSYPHRVGMGVCYRNRNGEIIKHHVLYPNAHQGLNPSELTISRALKEKGYETACIGKWHLGDAKEFLPTRHGFDTYFGMPYSNDMKPTVLLRGEEVVDEVDQETLIERYTEEAVKYIESRKDSPFFLFLSHNAPHTPLHVTDKFRGKSEGGLYGDVVESIDWSTGEVLKALKRAGIDEKTLVVFLSDNGPWLVKGEHGGSAFPFRNGKGYSYEGGFRVPFIARWPGAIPAGGVCTEMASAMDIFPTFLQLAGGEVPDSHIVDGKNILALLRGEAGAKSPHEVLYYYYMDQLQALRSGSWKLKLETVNRLEDLYIKYGDLDAVIPERLFNLETDISEQKSVLQQNEVIRNQLQVRIDSIRKDLGDDRVGAEGTNLRPAGFLDAD